MPSTISKKKSHKWKVSEPRKSLMNGQLMYRVDGPEKVKDYEDYGYSLEDVKLMASAKEMHAALLKIGEMLKEHPEFGQGNSKVHFCAHLAKSASSLK